MKNSFAGSLGAHIPNAREMILARDRWSPEQMTRRGRMPMINVLGMGKSRAPKRGAVHRPGISHGNFAVRAPNPEILQSREGPDENRRSQAAPVKRRVHSANRDVGLVAMNVGMRKSGGGARFAQDENAARQADGFKGLREPPSKPPLREFAGKTRIGVITPRHK